MAKPEAQLERSISAILTHNSTPVPEHELNYCNRNMMRGSPLWGRAGALVRTFPFLLLPFFPLLIDRGGAVAGAGVAWAGGCSRGLRLAPGGFSACVLCARAEKRLDGQKDACVRFGVFVCGMAPSAKSMDAEQKIRPDARYHGSR